jgi:tRNA A37 threonylcarbamoyladenosine dehydratase
MESWLHRTEMLFGKDAVERLKRSFVAVFGMGGVGGYATESLVRAGIGKIALFDGDVFNLSNLNRQLHATTKTLGIPKVTAVSERLKEINPDLEVRTFHVFYSAENSHEFDLGGYDYILDAIDTVSSKIELIRKAKQSDVRIISCMGAGNKLDPSMLTVSCLSKTSVCPLAKIMRHELKKYGIEKLKVVFSKEPPVKCTPTENETAENETSKTELFKDEAQPKGRKRFLGSNSFVPATAGLLMTAEAVKELGIRN